MSDDSSSRRGRFSARIAKFLTRPGRLPLLYFEDVLAAEFKSINLRRDQHARRHVAPLTPSASPHAASPHRTRQMALAGAPRAAPSRQLSPDPAKLFSRAAALPEMAPLARSPERAGFVAPGPGARTPEPPLAEPSEPEVELPEPPLDPNDPNYDKTRPQPVPCTATGLAFSGGGIRSAAICLGALQALHGRSIVPSIDYLSTVSGGGYIGACLSAAMSIPGGRAFPFGDDVLDSSAVSHLRNYSNYLMPRGRSSVKNLADASAIILRGLLANIVIVLAAALFCVLLSLVGGFLHWGYVTRWGVVCLAAGAVAMLLVWAALRSYARFDLFTDDTDSWLLSLARVLVIATFVAALVALQPIAIGLVARLHQSFGDNLLSSVHFGAAATALGALSASVSAWSGALGGFLQTSQNSKNLTTLALRWGTQVLVFAAALILPAAIWFAYLEMTHWGLTLVAAGKAKSLCDFAHQPIVRDYFLAFCVAAFMLFLLQPNGYSLHRFYRDRLSKAFLFVPPPLGWSDSIALDDLKLSQLRLSAGPFHIVNSALNVQGSKEANRRGRDADFFMFTRHVVGSDLTHYARIADIEPRDSRLDLATAMAISGAAVSANMGNSTIRLLSPTLALLNVQLGYWLRNPLHLGAATSGLATLWRWATWPFGKFYLLGEMFNLIDETSRNILLTDGGHIENLGVYELLKRGCQLIFVVDAEADPSLSFPALLTLERYARIDLGVRINLPWEEIAAMSRSVDASKSGERVCANGPHCAVGRILYQTGEQGIIVYIKSSLSGDEKDYVLDYKKRYASFPHETTGDQFFSEEQFEVYRALGYHVVEGLFSGTDQFSFQTTGPGAFADSEAAILAIRAMLAPTAKAWVAN